MGFGVAKNAFAFSVNITRGQEHLRCFMKHLMSLGNNLKRIRAVKRHQFKVERASEWPSLDNTLCPFGLPV